MPKPKKRKIEQEKELHKNTKIKETAQKKRMKQEVSNLMDSQEKKMSKGAANIFIVIKDRANWGNKQLWGTREKGRNKKGHSTPKGTKKK